MANRIFRGPTVVVHDTAYPCPDLLGEIKDAMAEEQDSPDVISADLIRAYGESADDVRAQIDLTLVRLCGYSMPTLLKACMAEDDLLQVMNIKLDGDDADAEPSE
jgi:hypothetical protein